MSHKHAPRRKQAIARYLADDKIEDICKAMACSKSWLYKWRDRYQADDPHWAQDRPTRPKISPTKTPKIIEQAVVSLRHALSQKGQGCGAASLQQALKQQGIEPTPSLRTIYRILHRQQKEVA
jgi:putative transposase